MMFQEGRACQTRPRAASQRKRNDRRGGTEGPTAAACSLLLVLEGDAGDLLAVLVVAANLAAVGATGDLLVGDHLGDGLGVRASLDGAGVGDGANALADVLLLVDDANLAHWAAVGATGDL